ncbi:PPE family protein [Mycobacterium decipiens]|uniref:PPE family protein n=1 Tax=Mycobacterium decipiens TaxID=1430326 RepID=A0A1X2LYC1_9MYCO|nr:PPE family protein [Mycobacterium decipiens]OSC42256.1 hypothetical protein B8W66_04540 [Mycobacterium decipiens]
MDFGALPPEINSARMYGGAGVTDLLAAGAAWNGIASELSTAASSFESVITRLTTEQWMGPASLSMVAAAQPYLVWLTYTAESSALAATQAMASAAAFESAFAMTVPPAEVAANRALSAELIATNILGQNVPAIAAAEARYGEMWAQDASAMYGYAASSAVAARLNPLTRPSHSTNPAGIANQAAAVGRAAASGSAQQVGLSNLITNVANAVMSLASPIMSAADAAGLDALRQILTHPLNPFVLNVFHGLGGVADFALNGMANAALLVAGDQSVGIGSAAIAGSKLKAAAVAPTPLSAGLGSASTVGRLSVPANWSTAIPATTVRTAVDGTGWAVPDEDGPIAALPPAPGMVATARSAAVGAGPRYGVKPTVLPKQGLF